MKKIFILSILFTSIFSKKIIAQVNESIFTINITGGVLEGSLISQPSKNKLAIIIAGSGPTDRNGNNPLNVKANSYKMLAEELNKEKIASIRYDKRAIGKSKLLVNDESKLLFTDYVNDAVALYKYAKDSLGYKEIYFIGHSEGSLIGMLATIETKAQGYISISGAGRSIDEIIEQQIESQPEEVKQVVHEIFVSLKAGKEVDDVPQALYTLFRPSVQPYMISWIKYNPSEEIKKLTQPILLINGTCDIQVKPSEAELLNKANPNSKLVIIKKMTHALKDTGDDCNDAEMKTYTDPTLPLNTELVDTIIKFIYQ